MAHVTQYPSTGEVAPIHPAAQWDAVGELGPCDYLSRAHLLEDLRGGLGGFG